MKKIMRSKIARHCRRENVVWDDTMNILIFILFPVDSCFERIVKQKKSEDTFFLCSLSGF